MNGLEAISAITDVSLGTPINPVSENQPAQNMSFGELIAKGIDSVETKVDTANDLVRQFAIDDSVPVHQVTIALEEARIAVELAVQIRSRLIEGYREIMNMQL